MAHRPRKRRPGAGLWTSGQFELALEPARWPWTTRCVAHRANLCPLAHSLSPRRLQRKRKPKFKRYKGCPIPARRTPRMRAWQGPEGRCWTSPKGGNRGACRSGAIDAWRLWRFGAIASHAHADAGGQPATGATADDDFGIGAGSSADATSSLAVPAAVAAALLPGRRLNEQRRHPASSEHDVHRACAVGGARIA